MTVPMDILTADSGGFAIPSLAALFLHGSHPLHRDGHKNRMSHPLTMQEKKDPGSCSGLGGIRDLMLPRSTAGDPNSVHLLLHAPKSPYLLQGTRAGAPPCTPLLSPEAGLAVPQPQHQAPAEETTETPI